MSNCNDGFEVRSDKFSKGDPVGVQAKSAKKTDCGVKKNGRVCDSIGKE